jgi:hypothetical protein
MKTIEHEWFIPHNPPSLKNSKQVSKIGDRVIVRKSKTVYKYLALHNIKDYNGKDRIVTLINNSLPNTFLESLETTTDISLICNGEFYESIGTLSFKECCEKATNYFESPLLLGFHQVRATNKKFDFGNSIEIIQDMLIAHDIIPDDNCSVFLPFPYQRGYGDNKKWYSVNPKKSGVYLKILNQF